jgi:hypothetical protein
MRDEELQDDDHHIPILAGMKQVVDAILSLQRVLIFIVTDPDALIGGEFVLKNDWEAVQRQINDTSAAMRRLGILMLNSEPSAAVSSDLESMPDVLEIAKYDPINENVDVSAFLVALRYFVGAFKHYAYKHYGADQINAQLHHEIEQRMSMERLMERELAAVVTELHKMHWLIEAMHPNLSETP